MHGEGDTGARPTARLDWDRNKPNPSNRAPDWLQAGGNIQRKLFTRREPATSRGCKSMEKRCFFSRLVRAGTTYEASRSVRAASRVRAGDQLITPARVRVGIYLPGTQFSWKQLC